MTSVVTPNNVNVESAILADERFKLVEDYEELQSAFETRFSSHSDAIAVESSGLWEMDEFDCVFTALLIWYTAVQVEDEWEFPSDRTIENYLMFGEILKQTVKTMVAGRSANNRRHVMHDMIVSSMEKLRNVVAVMTPEIEDEENEFTPETIANAVQTSGDILNMFIRSQNIHQRRVTKKDYDDIASGAKTIDCRLSTTKVEMDEMYSVTCDEKLFALCKIVKIHKYPTFLAGISAVGYDRTFPNECAAGLSLREAIRHRLRKFYTARKETAHGVHLIELSLVGIFDLPAAQAENAIAEAEN